MDFPYCWGMETLAGTPLEQSQSVSKITTRYGHLKLDELLLEPLLEASHGQTSGLSDLSWSLGPAKRLGYYLSPHLLGHWVRS